jgi:YYY domain-containing protein
MAEYQNAAPSTKEETGQADTRPRRAFSVWDALLIGILVLGAYFRFVGLDWDQDQHLHPDERFLTMVATSISPADSLDEYFDTAQSSLNPNNRGYSFYVYGTLPLFVVRYVAEWVGKTGYSEIYLVGRAVSAAADLLTILLVYLSAQRLYRKKAISLLAAAFSAFSVLQIQLSHYFTVDIFANLCSTLTFYLAVRILRDTRAGQFNQLVDMENDPPEKIAHAFFTHWGTALPYILFGAAFGMALASKVSSAPLVILLPGAVALNYARFTPEERRNALPFLLRNLFAAALVTILVFRIFQPYAFRGPGFFGMIPNQGWIDSLVELSGQSSGEVDFPPALQWARRSITFGYENLVKWGLGLPLGLLASAAFLWMAVRMLKGKWFEHALLWGWTAVVFGWQSLSFTSSMRYFLPIYPALAIMAAWLVAYLWSMRPKEGRKIRWGRLVSGLLGGVVLLGTLAWAFAFSRIYTRPVTRIAASEWIYQNIPGPINLHIDNGKETVNQPVPYYLAAEVSAEAPLSMQFTAQNSGSAANINFSHLLALESASGLINLNVRISSVADDAQTLATAFTSADFRTVDGDPRGGTYDLEFYPSVWLNAGETYRLHIELAEAGSRLQLAGPLTLTVIDETSAGKQVLLEPVELLSAANDSMITLNPLAAGEITEIYFPHIVDWTGSATLKTLEVSVIQTVNGQPQVTTAVLEDAFSAQGDIRGDEYWVRFDASIPVEPGRYITIQLRVADSEGGLALYGSKQALESSWDDTLPYNLYGNNVFDYYTGLYRSELNFEMYWDDNADKLERFLLNLDQADTLFISSNRQWGTTVRVPERYPLTTAYYRALLGCPQDKEVTWCYAVAEPGMFSGQLGFDLVQVFQSDPNIGPLRFNTQFAEEAFTVYDHPKVLIFRKTADYSPEKVQDILGAVDLGKVIHLTPKQASEYQGNLVLSDAAWARQQQSDTWRELFDRADLLNRYPGLGLIVWYVLIMLTGWCVYPLTRLVFGGLHDRGYGLSRLFGLLILAFLVWALGSAGVPFTRLTISLCFAGLVLLNAVLFIRARRAILAEIRENWRYFLLVEAVFLAVFVFDLLIRLGNPDLWHPYKGGEKPMDFSYFNAVLKSVTFPPYDPWYAGGYINYYYYGFVLLAVPVKWLGIVPSVAYNFLLPTLMAFLAMGVFTLGSSIVHTVKKNSPDGKSSGWLPFGKTSFLGGLAATVLMIFVGNLGTVRMIWHGIMKLAAPGGNIDGSNIFTRIVWTVQGLGEYIKGAGLPYGAGDWYWIPSRVYPNEPITEFPLFTFLYADLHAHLIALPITVLALCWAVSFIKYRFFDGEKPSARNWLVFGTVIFFGALVIGALRPTNTWDTPTYLALAVVAVFYKILKRGQVTPWQAKRSPAWRSGWQKGILAAAAVLVLAALTFALYAPFGKWYGQAYNSAAIWEGERSPAWSYLTHWGLFLFLIFSWMFWETRQWLAETPLSALAKLRPYKFAIQAAAAVLLCAILATVILHIGIGWMALLGAFWALVLLLRPGQPDMKRAVLFMTGTALVLTLAVELVVLEGDLGRMNTVFKFYLQAWTLLSVSAAASAVWLYPAVLAQWKRGWRIAWQAGAAVLLGAALLFTLFAGIDKIRDRMSTDAPHTLDGMTYMAYATYWQSDTLMDLSQDYQAILWMQENIDGTPVIVEANTPEYQWGSRYTIYTGLPGVVGWNWHQRQQRGAVSTLWVTDRVADIDTFYTTQDRQTAEEFLSRYGVQYIVVGQLEQAYYGMEGLAKFSAWDGDLWTTVYHADDTTIYQVLGDD